MRKKQASGQEKNESGALLQASELQYKTMLDSMSDAIHVVDKDLRIILCNQALVQWCRQLGLESNLVGMTVFESFPFLPEEVRDEYHNVFQTGEVLICEETTTFGDDGFDTESRKIPILDKGKVVQIITIIRNITERKRAAEALRQSEHNLRERVKELNCLYEVTEVINKCGNSLDDLLQGIVDILPKACQHPKSACARITVIGKKYQTDNFKKSPKKLATDILVAGEKVGVVDIFCPRQNHPVDERLFLKEEKSLIDTVAARIGRNIERVQSQRQLLVEHSALEQKNIALREVMVGVQDEKKEFGRRISRNVEKIVMPLLHALEQELPPGQRKYVDLLKGSLKEITLPFADRLSREFATLTPAEIRICHMIRRGLSTKQIADLQHISPATVNKHRERIRRKLRITNKDVNLVTYLENYMSDHETKTK